MQYEIREIFPIFPYNKGFPEKKDRKIGKNKKISLKKREFSIPVELWS